MLLHVHVYAGYAMSSPAQSISIINIKDERGATELKEDQLYIWMRLR